MIQKRQVVIFGAGWFAKKYLSRIEKCFEIKAFCDNDPEKWNTCFCEKYLILSVDEAVKNFRRLEFLVALTTKVGYDAVFTQLNELSISCRHINEVLFEISIDNGESFYLSEQGLAESERIKGDERNIFVLTAPMHSNLGDQAQSMCVEELLKEKYSGRLFVYDQATVIRNYFELLYIIKQYLKADDMIFLHSGYRLTNLYMDSVYAAEMMIELFGERKMVFLPQTVHFTEDEVKHRLSCEIGNNVTILCRDKDSLENAKEIFRESKNILYPDLVTSLIGKRKFKNKREGILICLRSSVDGESLLSNTDAENLAKELRKYDKVTFTDTTIEEDWKEIEKDREYYVWREIERYSHYKILVTNRFHGIVFGLASDTPVIALPTKDHKITAAVSWFNETGYRDVYLYKDVIEISAAVKKLFNNYKASDNSDYFFREYFEKFDPWNI